jgi:NitT/TauT family transport system substrate-binding protein
MFQLVCLSALAATIVAPQIWAQDVPQCSLAWSEYPSWSTFGVAHMNKVIDGRPVRQGEIEKKWNVDLVLKVMEYDPSIAAYAAGEVDAVTITNMDTINVALGRPSVMVLPTSTSWGADATLVPKSVSSVDQLKSTTCYGLEASVSEYMFDRCLSLLGKDPKDFRFKNRDPGAAAMAVQTGNDDCIVVWNPFVLETLKQRSDYHVIFDSTAIPNEIIDSVVFGQDALDRPGGDRCAAATIDAFYRVSQMIEDPDTRDKTLIALGQKFSSLGLQKMRKVVQQTKFYKTPEDGLALMKGDELPEIMKTVYGLWRDKGIVTEDVSIGYGSKSAAGRAVFRFDPTYIERYQKGR